jgi:rhodanese-related sulfurtransferase
MLQSVTAKQAYELLSQLDLDIVDVREISEWATGHLPGARLVPLAELRERTQASLPRDGVLFVCAAGVRSETAARLALQNGLTKVYNLAGGTRGWQKAGLPLAKDADVVELAPTLRLLSEKSVTRAGRGLTELISFPRAGCARS